MRFHTAFLTSTTTAFTTTATKRSSSSSSLALLARTASPSVSSTIPCNCGGSCSTTPPHRISPRPYCTSSTISSSSNTLSLTRHSSSTTRMMMSTTSNDASSNKKITGTEMMKALLKYKMEEQHVIHPELLGLNVPMSMEAFVNADCVCFDVDSTVIREEGIDVLAEYLGKGAAVATLTKQAMEGGMKFQDALSARLNLLQPSQLQIESCLRDHPFRLTDGIPELMQLLQLYHKDIYLISGGFRIMIEPIAKQLNIDPKTHVIANNILFDSDLLYNGFDTNEYTSQDMGKPKAIQSIYDANPIRYRKIVMIGDGMTDAQTKPPATTFIGFGGVVVRTNVQTAADWFITDFHDLIYLLNTYGPTTTAMK